MRVGVFMCMCVWVCLCVCCMCVGVFMCVLYACGCVYVYVWAFMCVDINDLPFLCGQTTLARILARTSQEKHGARFVQLSATTSGVTEIKEAIKVAKNEKSLFRKKTVLFIDEIHLLTSFNRYS